MDPLKHKRRLVAKSQDWQDFVVFLEEVRNSVCDVRMQIENDSIETRRAIGNYLQTEIDNIRRINDNKNSPQDDY